jgi:YfiR/HmsC-like
VLSKLALALLAGWLAPVWAAEPAAEEYRVKGAFLLNFAKFVEWPAEAFHGPGDAIGICVLGANPFTAALEQAAGQVVVEKRTVVVRQIADPHQASQCQIVFVSVSERKRVRAVLEAVHGASVLTVGESEGFIAGGGVIEFRVEESKVRMEISAAAAKSAGLRISAKLLSLSQSAKR